ncbi:MAG: ABC-ATPase domain-containing protein [Thermanaeromonas sp.]|uniref:ABC-ATPase domain-containing protein n=1 Tax=Thermanaeromonas sp. TaxID=2003697 RepID=UPI00243FF133|nr:ABC-ATPase domain-containing protein [Thermanaeromonas sp.]MCG0278626.1 ABC-ATPase domain-containing protein [Thermanaeromonas sp.]
MKNKEQLSRLLNSIDGRGYKAYKELHGVYQIDYFTMYFDYIQGDPFASPSRVRIRVDHKKTAWPADLWSTRVRRIALEDFLARRVAKAIRALGPRHRGTGKSGLLFIDSGGQEILPRTAMIISPDFVEVRLSLGLPARGRTILGREAAEMLFGDIPRIIEEGLLCRGPRDLEEARRHVAVAEDQEALREQLKPAGLVAFVGNGAILPRRSGISQLPLPAEKAIPFVSPPTLEVELKAPNAGPIRGMGIPQGITLIVGGGFHGKSTLLRALERGVYNHIPGDGRELVVTLADAVKIRAEDGRRVEKVDISPFINNLPYGQDTKAFSTEEASGSTSQAANIIEALEIGTSLLLLDEDTSATNFMIRDHRMQQLVAKEKEPITPFIDRVKHLKEMGISTIMVVGGSGDYFDVADTVIMMDGYIPRDVTSQAKEIAAKFVTHRQQEGGPFGRLRPRIPLKESFDPRRRGKTKIKAHGVDEITFGYEDIDLSYVEQLVDPSQTRAIGDIIRYLSERYCDNRRTLKELIHLVLEDINRKGLDIISPFYGQHPGDYALPRPQEIAAAINRLRTLKVVQA